MPDTKFSWPALREHLRKYLWVYLVGVALCLAGTRLLWTMTRPRPSSEQVVAVYLADSYSDPEKLSDIAANALARTRPFDDTLQEVRFESLLFSDMDYTGSMLLMTRLAVGECDAFFASQAAMDALVNSEALVPLDDYVASGWLSDLALPPYTAAKVDEDGHTGEPYVAGLRLDSVDALVKRQAFENKGAFLCVVNNGGNVETTMKALEFIMRDLMEASDAGTKAA